MDNDEMGNEMDETTPEQTPGRPAGYDVEDVFIPEQLKGITFDRNKFCDICHRNGLTIEQTKNLWSEYTQGSIDSYVSAIEQRQERENQQQEQQNQETVDQVMEKAERGDFWHTADELGEVVKRLRQDPAYWDRNFDNELHQQAVFRMNYLLDLKNKGGGDVSKWSGLYEQEKQERMSADYGYTGPRKTKSGERAPEQPSESPNVDENRRSAGGPSNYPSGEY